MKNKRNVLIAFILICCLCLSIGYASLADQLQITATPKYDVANDSAADEYFESCVGFTDVKLGTTTDGRTWSVKDQDSLEITTSGGKNWSYLDQVTFSVDGFSQTGDSVELTYYIKNSHKDLNATIAHVSTTPDSNTNFAITQSIDDNVAEKDNGDTAAVTVTITWNGVSTEEVVASFVLTYSATATVPTTVPTT